MAVRGLCGLGYDANMEFLGVMRVFCCMYTVLVVFGGAIISVQDSKAGSGRPGLDDGKGKRSCGEMNMMEKEKIFLRMTFCRGKARD